MRALVTGFGPFEKHVFNPSEHIARAVDGSVIEGVRIVGMPVPTSWTRAWRQISEASREVQPVALLMVGICTDRTYLLELQAKNYCEDRADCDGGASPSASSTHELIPGAPHLREGTFPFRSFLASFSGPDGGEPSIDGAPVRSSTDAGAYLCNQVYYHALSELASIVPKIGFLHIPPPSAQAVSEPAERKRAIDAGGEIVTQLLRHALTT